MRSRTKKQYYLNINFNIHEFRCIYNILEKFVLKTTITNVIKLEVVFVIQLELCNHHIIIKIQTRSSGQHVKVKRYCVFSRHLNTNRYKISIQIQIRSEKSISNMN